MGDSIPTPEPRYLRVFRGLTRVVFVWWVFVGGVGCLMSALMAEWIGAALGALFCAVGVYGWRVAKRPVPESLFSMFPQRREKAEKRTDRGELR
jgi:hypothetical protein